MKLPIGLQSFEKLREGGFLYVDKTEYIYRLASEGGYYFLSRPRRFGKSLLLSTFRAYFEGKRHLFEGLAVDRLERNWNQHPVMAIDLNTSKFDQRDSLDQLLDYNLSLWENLYGTDEKETTLALRFAGVIRRAAEKTGFPVVILVDEYDKPLLQTINNKDLQDCYRATLKSFHSVLKTQDEYIRFAFLTGVTKFSKVSIFSDLNNLRDISMLDAYSAICGLTEEEIHRDLDSEMTFLAEANQMSKDECYAMLKANYDGYHFSEQSVGVYNPFSVLNALANRKFQSYWFETGTPTYLVELLKNGGYDLNRFTTQKVKAYKINDIEGSGNNPVSVIYQSGYLTIKGYNPDTERYTLGFPNKEVEKGFCEFLIPYYLPVDKYDDDSFIDDFVDRVKNGDADGFIHALQTFLSGANYQIAGEAELYFQNAVFLICKMMGFRVQAEYATSSGRIDMLLQTSRYVYIIEFKLDRSSAEALAQINERGYADQFASGHRLVYKIGVNFSSSSRTITDWLIA